MALDLFAGIPVADHAVALMWYERLLGPAPETYSNGVRKSTYRDPDGNEIGFGGGLFDCSWE